MKIAVHTPTRGLMLGDYITSYVLVEISIGEERGFKPSLKNTSFESCQNENTDYFKLPVTKQG